MNTRSILTGILSLCVAGVVFSSCKSDTSIGANGKYAKIYMPQAINYPATHSLIMTDSTQTLIFGANYGGPDYPKSDIPVHFAVDSALVDSFNASNGTKYKDLPTDAYKISSQTATIPKGKLQTQPLKMKITTVGALKPHVDYLLPIKLETDHNVPINKDLQTTYFHISAHFELFDRSNWKVLEVDSYQKNPPFPGKNAIDGDPGTFWHTPYSQPQPPPPHHITIDMDTTHNVHGFQIIGRSGKFNQRGNPVDITIQVSNDTTNWGKGESFTLPFNKQIIKAKVYFSLPVKGRYFKLIVTSTFQNTKFTHIAEIYAF